VNVSDVVQRAIEVLWALEDDPALCCDVDDVIIAPLPAGTDACVTSERGRGPQLKIFISPV
jgi:hypothetical protein